MWRSPSSEEGGSAPRRSVSPASGKISSDISPAAMSAAASAPPTSPSSMPIAVAATMNGSDVAWKSPATSDRRAADADLGGRVLQALQVVGHAARALRTRDDEVQREPHGQQGADEQQRGRRAAALSGEEDREQDDRAEVGDRAGRDDELAER